METILRITLIALLTRTCLAATFYVSPSATVGDGSLTNPWSIYLGLNTNSISAGDTVLLRAGIYSGPGFVCTFSGTIINPITVQPYPGETVILTDGVVGILGTSMNASTSPIIITNSEHFRGGQSIGIGTELVQLSAISGSPTNWIVNRGWGGTTAVSHSVGASCYVYTPYILDHQAGSNVFFKGLTITSPMSTNRVFTLATNFALGLNMGIGDKVLNCTIYNVGQPGIGAFFHTPGGGEVNGCIIWGCGEFDDVTFCPTCGESEYHEYRGSGIYAQNEGGGGLLIVKDCVFMRQVTAGAKVFGEAGPVRDFKYIRCISLKNGRSPLEIQSGSSSVSNTWMQDCFVTGTPPISYVSLNNVQQYFIGNTIVNGGFSLTEATDCVLTNNRVFMSQGALGDSSSPVQYRNTHVSSNSLSITWDYNTYHLGLSNSIYQWAFVSSEGQQTDCLGAGSLAFNEFACLKGWTDVSRFDQHSTCTTNWPNNYLNVRSVALDYNTNRHRVTVVSTSGATTASIDLSTNNIPIGARCQIRDIQNYFKVIQDFTYAGGLVTLPLNLTSISPFSGSVTNFIPTHTDLVNDAGFNVFDIDNLGTPQAVIANGTIVNAHF